MDLILKGCISSSLFKPNFSAVKLPEIQSVRVNSIVLETPVEALVNVL